MRDGVISSSTISLKESERPPTSELASSEGTIKNTYRCSPSLAYFRIEHWYHLIKDETFPTTFMAMTLEEAQALIK